MICLQGMRFGMNRMLHVFAKKKRRFAAAALAQPQSDGGVPESRPFVLLGPGRRRASPEAGVTAACLVLPVPTSWVDTQMCP